MATEIVDGKYDDTGLLPAERKLMERYDVGRPAIREAIFALARRGLVEQRQGRRVRVLKPNVRHVVSELELVVRGVLRDSTSPGHLMEV
ncbi:GntR family transcriptional regulator, partial [Stenotrophomonas sp. GbtcB23]|uniref:GntR family transcriptional regulator n=1 Tax=Stenotrophomonas sp. GbtcB23 TaxID=2824768 RepID=UPI002671A64F